MNNIRDMWNHWYIYFSAHYCKWPFHALLIVFYRVHHSDLPEWKWFSNVFPGDFSWGFVEETPGVTPALVLPTSPPPVSGLEDDEESEDMEEEVQATVARLAEAFHGLCAILTPLFFRGFFAFFTWWVAACQVISSLFGIYFHQYLMHNWKGGPPSLLPPSYCTEFTLQTPSHIDLS